MIITLEERHMRGVKPDVRLVPGTWVAGGAVRRWFTGEKQENDIDIFCSNLSEYDGVADEFIKVNDLTERIRNERMVMFKNSPIQLLLQPRFTTSRETIEHFDFTLCQFAWIGGEIIATLEGVLSTLRNHLAVAKIQSGFEIDSLRRAFKYAKQGYQPCIGTVRDLATALNNAATADIEKFKTISPDRWD